MKPLCAKCKVPLVRSPETGALSCPSCGDTLGPAPAGEEDGFGSCPNCERQLEYDAVISVMFCPACDEALRPETSPPPPGAQSQPAPEPEPQPEPEPEPEPPTAPEDTSAAELPEEESSPTLPAEEGIMSSRVSADGKCRVLTFRGRVGEREYEEFKDAVREGARANTQRLIVDLSEMTYISSSGLSVLIWAHGELAARGLRMIVVNVPPRTRRLLEIISVDHLLEFAENVKEALDLPDHPKHGDN